VGKEKKAAARKPAAGKMSPERNASGSKETPVSKDAAGFKSTSGSKDNSGAKKSSGSKSAQKKAPEGKTRKRSLKEELEEKVQTEDYR
jgi:hypothetical protein